MLLTLAGGPTCGISSGKRRSTGSYPSATASAMVGNGSQVRNGSKLGKISSVSGGLNGISNLGLAMETILDTHQVVWRMGTIQHRTELHL